MMIKLYLVIHQEQQPFMINTHSCVLQEQSLHSLVFNKHGLDVIRKDSFLCSVMNNNNNNNNNKITRMYYRSSY
jgi:hypothetical protein